ncbi:MAG: AAA family ATPase, partial [Candidatus Binatia bacterium]
MGRIFIVGDIHGCPQELETLLTALSLRPEDRLVFLGDYIDRGPGSRDVIDLLLSLRSSPVCDLTFLKGNHEDMFLDFLGYEGRYGEAFVGNGGQATLRSYGVPPDVAGDEVAELLPPVHLQFFRELETFTEVAGDFLCVHAGVNPLLSLGEQTTEELLWIRQEFIAHSHMLPYTIVFGHTPHRSVRFDLPYKIGIDTGLVYGGKLSCLEVTEKRLLQVSKGSSRVQESDVARHWNNAAAFPTRAVPSSPVHQAIPSSLTLDPSVFKTVFSSDSHFFYSNPVYEEVYKNVLNAIRERKGLILLVGRPGTGKSKLIHLLSNSLEETVHKISCNALNTGFDTLLQELGDCLSLRLIGQSEQQQIEGIEDSLWAWTSRSGAQVLIIDDAHHLAADALKKLPLLLDREGPYGKLLQILLVARPELETRLGRKEFLPLQERIGIRCRLTPLRRKEVDAFIHHRFRAAGLERQDLFVPEVIQKIATHSQAIPQQINALCDNAMAAAYATGQSGISSLIVEETAAALKGSTELEMELIDHEAKGPTVANAIQELRNSLPPPSPPLMWRIRQALARLGKSRMIIGFLLLCLVAGLLLVKPLARAWKGYESDRRPGGERIL